MRNYSRQFGASVPGYFHVFIPGYHPAAPASEAIRKRAISKEKVDATHSWCSSPGPRGLGHGCSRELWGLHYFTDLGKDLLQGQVYQTPLPQLVAAAALRGCQ